MIATWVAVLAVIALIPATIAQRKGLSFWTYYIFGLILWIVAVPAALMAKDMRPRCPECAENVKPEARVCPHCHSPLEGRIVTPEPKRIERIL